MSYPAGVVFYCKLILYVITMNYTCSTLAIAKYTRPRHSYVYTQKYQAANTVMMTRHNLDAVPDPLCGGVIFFRLLFICDAQILIFP